MARSGVIRPLKPENAASTAFTGQPTDNKQLLLNLIGQDLTGIPDRETLLRSAVSYLRRDLCYEGARIVLKETGRKLALAPNLFKIPGPAPAAVPIQSRNEILGNIIIPLNGRTG